MKTNETIAALRYCQLSQHTDCWGCPANIGGSSCLDALHKDAADALEAQQKRIEELEAERDAAVEAIRKMLSEEYGTICEFCAHDKNKDALCAKPANGSGGWCCQNARWRGIPGGKEGKT